MEPLQAEEKAFSEYLTADYNLKQSENELEKRKRTVPQGKDAIARAENDVALKKAALENAKRVWCVKWTAVSIAGLTTTPERRNLLTIKYKP